MEFVICNIWFYQAQNSCPQRQVSLWQFDAYETKSNLFTLIWFLYCSLQVLWRINTTTYFPVIDNDRFTLSENNSSLSRFLENKRIKMFTSQNILLHALSPLGPGGNKRSYILKKNEQLNKSCTFVQVCIAIAYLLKRTPTCVFQEVRNHMFPVEFSIFTKTKIVWFENLNLNINIGKKWVKRFISSQIMIFLCHFCFRG